MKNKKEVKYREMTKNEELICVNLGNVRYGTGASFDKRLGNNLSAQANGVKLISEKQVYWMYKLLFKYRRQLPNLYQANQDNPLCTRIKNKEVTND